MLGSQRLAQLLIVWCVFAGCHSATTAAEPSPSDLPREIHRQIALIDQSPQFLFRWRATWTRVASMQGLPDDSINHLRRALDEPTDDTEMQVSEWTFGWRPNQFLLSQEWKRLPEPVFGKYPGEYCYFGTDTLCWHRMHSDASVPPRFTLRKGTASMWDAVLAPPDHLLRATLHTYWWGDNSDFRHSYNRIPPAKVTYVELESEEFGGERCRVFESKARQERLWIGHDSHRLRGYLQYIYQGRFTNWYESETVTRIAGRKMSSLADYRDWRKANDSKLTEDQRDELNIAFGELCFEAMHQPYQLIVFGDYREVAPGVWWPFHQTSTQRMHSQKNDNLFDYSRYDIEVLEATSEVADLAMRWEPWLPKEGERVQDQRFDAPVNYEFRADRSETEILLLVAQEVESRRKGEEEWKKLQAPFDLMVGQPAPKLPDDGWVGKRPDTTGKPYLLHFWATWCGPCKNDLPLLNEMAKHRLIIGIHPAGTAADQVQEAITKHELVYPTWLAANETDLLAGYPVKAFPYCVLIGADGKVIAHGSLNSNLRDKWPETK